MIKCIIVDDEPLARKSLERLCDRESELKVLGSFEDAAEALSFLREKEVDLIFLDIEMPKMSGLELLDVLPVIPQIVFTTGNKEYAYEAYEYDVTDFLSKPITESRFRKAFEKVKAREDRLSSVRRESALREIYLRTDGRLVRLPLDEIYFFENVGDYIKAVSSLGNHVFHGTIKGLAEHISHPRFLKIHRSYIINMDHIVDIEDSTMVIQGKVIPISRAHRPILLKMINIH